MDGQLTIQPVESLVNQWVVARSDCLYNMTDLSSVPAAQRDRVLQHKCLQWSPFKNSGHYVFWDGAIAMVWLWDADVIVVPESIDNIEFIPESVLGEKHADGLVFRACLQGFEGQCWQKGILKASVWWPVSPTRKDRQQLAAAAGLDFADSEIPACLDTLSLAQMRDQPWGKHYWLELMSPRILEQLLPGVCLIGLVAALGYYCATTAVSLLSLKRAEVALEERQALVADVIDDRNAAYRLLGENNTMLSLLNQPSQLQLFEQVVALLPVAVDKVSEWRYQGNKIEVTLKINPELKLDPRQLVAGLESSPYFESVLVNMNNRRRGYWQLTIDLRS